MMITLEKLIEALNWIKEDERDFDLTHPVMIHEDVTVILSDNFIRNKVLWYLKIKE